ncbi:MHO_1580 family protein [Mycoplasma todarodis]|uniref:Uncharacterized protein n=1 Tax=Mycoplasma todarodis TaxID=1937191 RepID=A0A4V2NHW5_9MOLU|nr:hypothetical protein [Mycoplasma todarodis]TCG10398.1 hypothetical protein C4B25_04355 [Mycoplasma todarodis]
MIPVVLNKPPQNIPRSIVEEKEEMNFSTSASFKSDSGIKHTQTFDDFHEGNNTYGFKVFLSIKRHLRSNLFSISMKYFKSGSDYDFTYIVLNGKPYSWKELEFLETDEDEYAINPDSGLTGFSSEMQKLSSIVIVASKEEKPDQMVSFKINFRSHKNTERKTVSVQNRPIDLESVNDANFVYSFSEVDNSFSATHWKTYNHFILKPLPLKRRVIKDIYDIYSYNDSVDDDPYNSNSESEVSSSQFKKDQKFYSKWSNDTSIEKDVNFHGGNIEGLKAYKNTKMETWIDTEDSWGSYLGSISIKNYSYYDFEKKKTVIEPGDQAVKGYVYPLNESGKLKTFLTLEPNVAYKKLKIYRQYNFKEKILDVREGDVSLEIKTPKYLSSKIRKTFVFNKNSFENIILNDLSLESLEKISDE